MAWTHFPHCYRLCLAHLQTTTSPYSCLDSLHAENFFLHLFLASAASLSLGAVLHLEPYGERPLLVCRRSGYADFWALYIFVPGFNVLLPWILNGRWQKPQGDLAVKLKINDIEVEVEDGSSVFQACVAAGVEVPSISATHDKLSVAGNCRMCLVELENAPKPIASCAFPAADGMVVRTDTPSVEAAREGGNGISAD